MLALTWPTFTFVTDVAGSAPGGVVVGVAARNVGTLPGWLFAAVTFTITPVIFDEFGTPLAPRIGSVSCSKVPIDRPLGQPAGTGTERVSSNRVGPTGTSRAPVSAVSE